jgi:hypothetical protein
MIFAAFDESKRAPRSVRTRPGCGVLRGIRTERNSILQWLLRLPTAPGLPLKGDGDFGTSAFFGQLSDKPLLARTR